MQVLNLPTKISIYVMVYLTITDVIKDKIYHNNKSSHTICQNDNWFHALNGEYDVPGYTK